MWFSAMMTRISLWPGFLVLEMDHARKLARTRDLSVSLQAELLFEIPGFDPLWPSGQVLSRLSDDVCSGPCHVTRECGSV